MCQNTTESKAVDFWAKSECPSQLTYKRMVSVEDSLWQKEADADRIIMLESSKLLKFTSQRKLPVGCETTVLEILRKTKRQLVELYKEENLAERTDFD